MADRITTDQLLILADPALDEAQARTAIYRGLMWPEWNPGIDRHGMTANEAIDLLHAYRDAVLREAGCES